MSDDSGVDEDLKIARPFSEIFIEVSTKAIPAGKVELKAYVNYSEDGKNKTIALFINGEAVGTKDLGKISNVSSGYDNLEVGQDIGSTVSPVYKAPFAFSGQLDEVVLELRDNGSSASIK